MGHGDRAHSLEVKERVGNVNGLVGSSKHLRFKAQPLDALGQAVVAIDLAGRALYWYRCAERLLSSYLYPTAAILLGSIDYSAWSLCCIAVWLGALPGRTLRRHRLESHRCRVYAMYQQETTIDKACPGPLAATPRPTHIKCSSRGWL